MMPKTFVLKLKTWNRSELVIVDAIHEREAIKKALTGARSGTHSVEVLSAMVDTVREIRSPK